MSVETWGMMPKSQVDPEKVEEAVDRIVEEHNDDPEAHLAEGQSFQSHRASEIIDHRARAVVGDKINDLDDAWERDEDGLITAFTISTITDIDKEWEIDQWVDHWVFVVTGLESATFRRITANTANELTFVGGAIPGIALGQIFIITKIKYFGTWRFFENIQGAYNNRVAKTETVDDYLEYSFKGNKIAVFLSRLEDGGDVEIYIDDVLQDTINLWSDYTQTRFIVWETSFETIPDEPRVLKLVAKDTTNPGSSILQVEAIDVNGIVAFSSLNIPMYTVNAGATTDANGYATFNITPPRGYYFIGLAGYTPESVGTTSDQHPKVYLYLSGSNYKVSYYNAKALTNFGFNFQFLLAKKDPYVET